MLRISKSELKLTSHGYHFDDRGRKYVRIFTSLDVVKVQVKLQKHRDLHVIWMPGIHFTDNWMEITFPYQSDIRECIDQVLNKIWFV